GNVAKSKCFGQGGNTGRNASRRPTLLRGGGDPDDSSNPPLPQAMLSRGFKVLATAAATLVALVALAFKLGGREGLGFPSSSPEMKSGDKEALDVEANPNSLRGLEGSKHWYPVFSSMECRHGDDAPLYMKRHPDYLKDSLAACCKAHFGWILVECMGEDAPALAVEGFFPSWEVGRDDHRCTHTNETMPPNYMLTDAADYIYDTAAKCCDRWYSWDSKNCLAQTTGDDKASGSNQYWVHWGLSRCVRDCPVSSSNKTCGGLAKPWDELFPDYLSCCDTKLPWLPTQECAPDSVVEVGSSQYWVDWSIPRCVKDCSLSSGDKTCGGLARPWNELYNNVRSCCDSKLGWMSIEECAPDSDTNSTEIEFSATTALKTVVTATMGIDLGNIDYSSLDETARSAFVSSLEEAISIFLSSTWEGSANTVDSVTIISIGGTPVDRRLLQLRILESGVDVEFSVQVTSPCSSSTCETDGSSISNEVAGALGDGEAVGQEFAQSDNEILQQATSSGDVSINRIDTEVSEGAGSCPMPMAGTACLLTMHYLQTSEVKGGSWCSGDGLSMRPNVCGDREVVTCFGGDGGALYHLSCDESAPVLPEQW
ncbi:hypothetical protein ACHAWF_005204, partial [Thalassiosira exigua]